MTTTSPTAGFTRRFAIVGVALTALMMLLSATYFSPVAEAQAPVFGAYIETTVGTPCPTGSTLSGASGSLQLCAPNGFAQIRSQALCNQSPGGIWFPSVSVCAARGIFFATTCGAPTVLVTSATPGIANGSPFPFDGCLIPLLVKGVGGSKGSGFPVCIESSYVQGDPAAAGLSVGNSFVGSDGLLYFIHSGAPTCKFNCENGFDMNCDGKIGDYCAIELDLNKVDDVKTCLESLWEHPAPS